MRILIGFECSGIVRDAFLARGHDAWSCDTTPDENGLGTPHIMGDIDMAIMLSDWDLIILHPPCQHIAVSGNAHHADKAPRRLAVRRVQRWWDAACKASPRVALENPVGVLSSAWRPPAQYIQPYHFGEDASKKTGLWLDGLPKLRPTGFIEPDENGVWGNQTPSGQNKLGPSPTRAADRARTYQGIADAMANQWG